jgi:hypothetical protein
MCQSHKKRPGGTGNKSCQRGVEHGSVMDSPSYFRPLPGSKYVKLQETEKIWKLLQLIEDCENGKTFVIICS